MPRVKLRYAAAALIAAAAFIVPPAARAQEPADQLLREAMAAPARLSYVGEVQVMRFGDRRSEAAIYRIEHRAPDLTRRWYLAPQDLYGDSIISRGETTYSVDLKRNRVVVTNDDAIDDQVAEDDNFGLLTSNYKPAYAPDQTVDGRKTHVIVLDNKHTGLITMRVYVDDATKLVVQKEQYAGNGSLLSQVRFSALRFVSSIPTSLFDVPKNLQTVQGPSRGLPSSDLQTVIKDAGFDAKGPKYLPEGFTPVEGDVADVKGVRTLHLLYSDGVRTLSLFQNAKGAAVDMSHFRATSTKLENREASYVQEGPTTLLAWAESGLHFALVGELNLQELEKIAESVVP